MARWVFGDAVEWVHAFVGLPVWQTPESSRETRFPSTLVQCSVTYVLDKPATEPMIHLRGDFSAHHRVATIKLSVPFTVIGYACNNNG